MLNHMEYHGQLIEIKEVLVLLIVNIQDVEGLAVLEADRLLFHLREDLMAYVLEGRLATARHLTTVWRLRLNLITAAVLFCILLKLGDLILKLLTKVISREDPLTEVCHDATDGIALLLYTVISQLLDLLREFLVDIELKV